MTPKNIPLRGTDDQAGGVWSMQQRHGVVHDDHGWSNTRHAWRRYAAAEGIISSWNPGAEKLFGYTAAEAIGQPMLILIPPKHASEEPGILARTAPIPLIVLHADLRVNTAAGNRFDLVISDLRLLEGRFNPLTEKKS